jgi:hypothetical protein
LKRGEEKKEHELFLVGLCFYFFSLRRFFFFLILTGRTQKRNSLSPPKKNSEEKLASVLGRGVASQEPTKHIVLKRSEREWSGWEGMFGKGKNTKREKEIKKFASNRSHIKQEK